MLDRARHLLDRHGPVGLARRVVETAWSRVYLHEEHIWYELPLDGERERRALAPGLELVEADEAQTRHLGGLPAMSPDAAQRRRARGGRLYLVLDGEQPLFACWIHALQTPAIAARGGWLSLPSGVVCLEDSVTAPAARGRGVAPAAWSELAERLAGEGVASMITKVGVENAPSRKAVEKAGFREFAVMRLRRLGPRTEVKISGDSPLAAQLRGGLGR